jgi:flagellar protein FliT
MTSTEVLSMYENIAGLTNQMVLAARTGDWDDLTQLEGQCEAQAHAANGALAVVSGAPRVRKIELLKQILANDRAIRNITEPWMTRLFNAAQAPHQQS